MIAGMLNELEILKIAIGIEEAGYKFYKQAVEHFKDEDLKIIFEHLALEELDHINTFERIYKKLSERQEDKEYLYDEEVSTYLKALSETAVFNRVGLTLNMMDDVHGAKQALMIGIQAEKDSILFYEAVVANTKEEMTSKVLKRLIKEEIKHLHELRNLINQIQG